MFVVYEIFKDGKKFWRHESEDEFMCEVFVSNHEYGTNALKHGWSKLIIEERKC